MRVVLLGCGGSAGVPVLGGPDGSGDWGACDPAEPKNRRTRSSIVVESGPGRRLLVDTSPDLRNQLLDCRVRSIDAVLFTHAHADHIAGLDDVRILNRIVNKPLEAFASEATLAELTRRFGYAFRPWEPPGFFRPVLVPRVISPGQQLDIAEVSVRIFRQSHGRSDSLGLRIGMFGYSTDVVALDDAAMEALEGVDTWVVGCFLRQGPHWTHADLNQVLAWVEQLRPRRTVLTHMGPDMDWDWMHRNLPPGVEAGFDGLVLDLPDPPEHSSRHP